MMIITWSARLSLFGLTALLMQQPARSANIQIESKNLRIEFDSVLHSRVTAKFDKETTLGAFSPSESISAGGATIADFNQTAHKEENVRDERGRGRRLTLTGASGGLQKTVIVTIYDENPRMAFYQVRYTQKGTTELRVSAWTNHAYSIAAADGAGEPAFWSYQSGSYRNRPDWVLPLKTGFKQENFLGMNAT